MFSNCQNLINVNLSSLNTQNSTLSGMFNGCRNLAYIDLSSFNINNNDISNLFSNCLNLYKIKIHKNSLDGFKKIIDSEIIELAN